MSNIGYPRLPMFYLIRLSIARTINLFFHGKKTAYVLYLLYHIQNHFDKLEYFFGLFLF